MQAGPPAQRRGTLRVYLGAAPGVGKTYAALSEARRRSERGTDVVVGVVETHGRAQTAEQLAGLELVARRRVSHRGSPFEEMDVDAVLARRPEVALVDELAHTNVPGSRNAKRWMDVEELLDAGIDVVTTVNIQHLESLNDVVEGITGVRQRETVPDAFVRRADQVELVDMSPQALRRRLAHGNVYRPERIDAALTSYFRVGNLTALRELALLWTADRVDAALGRYRAEEGITAPWAARERVVVALTGGPEGETLLRRGARITERALGGELLALHVLRSDGLAGAAPDLLDRHRALTEELGGTFHTVQGDDVATAILEFARGVNATQVVLGASRRGRWAAAVDPGAAPTVVRESGDIDVHIVTHDAAGSRPSRPYRRGALRVERVAAGWALTVVGLPLLTLGLHLTRAVHSLTTVLMLFLAWTVAVALVGGRLPAVVTALAAGLLANYLFTPPLYTWTIAQGENALAIAVLVAVAVAVSWIVDLAARRTVQAVRARREADTLTVLAGSVIRGKDAVPALLDQLRETFALTSVALVERGDDGWTTIASAGLPDGVRAEPGQGGISVPVRDGLLLVAQGPRSTPGDLRVLTAVALQVDAMLERDRLRAAAREARKEHERASFRAALLAAVSHDLRTPLASIKAGVSSLRSPGIELSDADEAELLGFVEEGADRLQSLIDNLLDLSRLDAGAVAPHRREVALEDVVARALVSVGTHDVLVDVPETLPTVLSDAGLLERVAANLVENAVRHAPPGTRVLVQGTASDAQVVLRVVDRGPGVPAQDRERMFGAFQRLGDVPNGHGVGLGLAVARGFTAALGGSLEAEDTPGGGLTMVLALPRGEDASADVEEEAL